jgi:sec-independent protein translocase protein TatA
MPGFVGMPELLLLALVALVIFGPKRLPEMGRGLGKGMREFKESVTGSHEPAHLEHAAPEPAAVVVEEMKDAA